MTKHEEKLTPAQLAELTDELKRELERVERSMQISEQASQPVALDQSAVGRLSRMDAMQNQHMSADLHSRERARHAQILDALDRMEQGTYGACRTCGTLMPYGRLLVFPEARDCARCGASS